MYSGCLPDRDVRSESSFISEVPHLIRVDVGTPRDGLLQQQRAVVRQQGGGEHQLNLAEHSAVQLYSAVQPTSDTSSLW